MIYVIIADGVFDQIVETSMQAKKERRDLEKMGCEVKVKRMTWQDANALETKMQGRE